MKGGIEGFPPILKMPQPVSQGSIFKSPDSSFRLSALGNYYWEREID